MNGINQISDTSYYLHYLTLFSLSVGLVFSSLIPAIHGIPAAAYAYGIPISFVTTLVLRVLTLRALYKSIDLKKSANIPNLNGFRIDFENLRDFNEGRRVLRAFFNLKEESEVPAPSIRVEENVQRSPLRVQAPVENPQVQVQIENTPVPSSQQAPPPQIQIQIENPPAPSPQQEMPLPQVQNPPVLPSDSTIKGYLYKVTFTDGSSSFFEEGQLPKERGDVLYIEQEWKKVYFYHGDVHLKLELPKDWKLESCPRRNSNYVLSFPSNFDNTSKAIGILQTISCKTFKQAANEASWEVEYRPRQVVNANGLQVKSKRGQRAAMRLLKVLDKTKRHLPSDKTWIKYSFKSFQKLLPDELPKDWFLDEVNSHYELYFPLEIGVYTIVHKILLEKGVQVYSSEVYKKQEPEQDIQLESQATIFGKLVK